MDYIQNRKLKIHLLKMASGKVDSGYFICGALSVCCELQHMDYPQLDVFDAVFQIQKYITDALAPYSYYSAWLFGEHPESYHSLNTKTHIEGRLAWINWMIACYEEDIANYKKEIHGK